jgi:hypothetical protein
VDSAQAPLFAAGEPGRWLRLGRRVRIPLGITRQAILAPALSAARLSRQRFAKAIAWFISRSLVVIVDRLSIGGLTFPLLPTNIFAPLIVLDARLLQRDPRELALVLLHEGAHHCGVVWPEWRNWVNSLARWGLFFVRWRDKRHPVFPQRMIYGAGVNSADNVAQAIIDDAAARGWRG